MRTPKIPFNEQVQSHVVVVTGKDKLRSNSLPFLFIPSAAPTMYYNQRPSPSPPPFVPPQQKMARLSPSYSPQPRTPPSASRYQQDMFGDIACSPVSSTFEQTLDFCAEQLDLNAEVKILAGVDSLPMQGTSPQSFNTMPNNKTTFHL